MPSLYGEESIHIGERPLDVELGYVVLLGGIAQLTLRLKWIHREDVNHCRSPPRLNFASASR